MPRAFVRSAVVLSLVALAACVEHGADEREATPTAPSVDTPTSASGALRDLRFGLPLPAPARAMAYPEAAKVHLARIAPRLGVAEATLARLVVAKTLDLGRGAVVVELVQRIDGLDVLGAEAKVVLARDGALVSVAGQVYDDPPPRAAFTLSPREAVASVVRSLVPRSRPALAEAGEESGGYTRVETESGDVRFDAPARARRVLRPSPGGLVAAYEVEVFLADAGDHRAIVGADDGAVLARTSLVADAFAYTVFAESSGDHRPFDGPQENFTPHPRGVPDGTDPAYVLPNAITIDGFNQNPAGAADPWLPPGATETRGNNVDAYTDLSPPNGFSAGDLRASVTAPGAFARVYDTQASPLVSPDQQMAAVTHLFYVNNWLHDYFYDSGFDEIAGNAQSDNLGRGGIADDPLLVEAQDGYPANRNNANMSTPGDGRSPRMQMFVYDGPVVRQVVSFGGGASVTSTVGPFGPSSFDVAAELVVADDGAGVTTDACSPLVGDVAGKVVIATLGGGCTAASKASRITAAGGLAAVLVDDVASANPPPLGPSPGFPGPYVPTVGIRKADGDAARALVGAGTTTSRLERVIAPERDGALDSTVVAHEWGHYLHHRLARCTTHQCRAMSEGFGDFSALHLVLREGDDPARTYGRGIYVGRARRDSGYFGNRRYPYSTDLGKNPLTFRHIMDASTLPAGIPNASTGNPGSEVHNAGEVWASALFEVYAALLARETTPRRSFATVRRLMADALVGGLRATPPEARYTEARDAILAVLYARDPNDAEVAGKAFAKRKMGVCARPPELPDSPDFAGVVESDATADVTIEEVRVDDSERSCDHDGRLDAGELGMVNVTLSNRGTSPTAVELAISSNTEGIAFPRGASVTVPIVGAFGRTVAKIPISLVRKERGKIPLRLSLRAPLAPSCAGALSRDTEALVDVDVKRASSRVDDVEDDDTTWAKTGTRSELVWSRVTTSALDHHFHADDSPTVGDTQLVSVEVGVRPNEPFVVSFRHGYALDAGDGAVVEISEDRGTTWKDVTAYGANPYNATIPPAAGTALAGKRAFSGTSAAARVPVALGFGTVLAGKRVRIRFRLVTDSARGGAGWDIDDIGFSGIEETPFATVVADEELCNGAPVARAGDDTRVGAGDELVLDGSQSEDPDGDPLSFVWTQTAGPPAEIRDATTVRATVVAPLVASEVPLAFELRASDGRSAGTDAVTVVVYPRADEAPPPTEASPTGCSCDAAGAPAPSPYASLVPVVALSLLAARRGRRLLGRANRWGERRRPRRKK